MRQEELSPIEALSTAQLWAMTQSLEDWSAPADTTTRGARRARVADVEAPTTVFLPPKFWAAFTVSISSLDQLSKP